MPVKRKDIKLLIKSIRNKENETAKRLIDSYSEIIHCKAKTPPKKDDGQIPLQIAFKTGNYEIAWLLIERGSNVNFIETESINEWKAPVLHDAIRSAVFSILFYCGSKDSAEAFKLLQAMISKGADPNARDSYGNSCLDRVLLDANQVIKNPSFEQKMEKYLAEVFEILINAGADKNSSCETRESPSSFAVNIGLERFLI